MSKAQRETDRPDTEQEVSLGQDRIPRTAAEVDGFLRTSRRHALMVVPVFYYGAGKWRSEAFDIFTRSLWEAITNPDPMLDLDKEAHNG